MKRFYYVQVTQIYKCTDDDGKVSYFNEKRYVTEINYTTQICKWKIDKKPIALTRQRAEGICQGLLMNMFNAQVVMTYYELSESDNMKGGDHNNQNKIK